MLLLTLRLISAPVLILGATAIQRRFGQSVGGRIVGLPLTSLPILGLICISEGPGFAGRAAGASLDGAVAQSVWCLVYVWTARRFGPARSLAASTTAFAASCLLLYPLVLAILWATLLGGASIIAALAVWPQGERPSTTPALKRRGDLAARVLAGTAFSVAITTMASTLGPRASGLLTAFPVLTVVLAVATHLSEGEASSRQFLEGVLAGSLSVVAGLATVALTLGPFGPAVAFPLSVTASGAAQLVRLKWAVGIRPALSQLGRKAIERGWMLAE
ncbi:MAG: hypothetical protein WAM97_08175 [Acidimicrobiales bacterium]